MTLARVRREATPAQRVRLATAIASLDIALPPPFQAREVVLVRSHLSPRGPRYEVLSHHPRTSRP